MKKTKMTPWLIFTLALALKSETIHSFNMTMEPDGKEVGDRNDVRVDIMRFIYTDKITVDGYYARLRNVSSARLNLRQLTYEVEFTLEASNCPSNRSIPRDHIYTSRCKGYGSLNELFCKGTVSRLTIQRGSKVECKKFFQHRQKKGTTTEPHTTAQPSHDDQKEGHITEPVSVAEPLSGGQEKGNGTEPRSTPRPSRDREEKDDLEKLLASLEASRISRPLGAGRKRKPSRISRATHA